MIEILVIGAFFSHALLSYILYWGTGKTDAPIRKCVTIHLFIGVVTALGAARGYGGQNEALVRIIVAALVIPIDLLRLKGRKDI